MLPGAGHLDIGRSEGQADAQSRQEAVNGLVFAGGIVFDLIGLVAQYRPDGDHGGPERVSGLQTRDGAIDVGHRSEGALSGVLFNQGHLETGDGQTDLGMAADVGQAGRQQVGVTGIGEVTDHVGVAQEGRRSVVLAEDQGAGAEVPLAEGQAGIRNLLLPGAGSFREAELHHAEQLVGHRAPDAEAALGAHAQQGPFVAEGAARCDGAVLGRPGGDCVVFTGIVIAEMGAQAAVEMEVRLRQCRGRQAQHQKYDQ